MTDSLYESTFLLYNYKGDNLIRSMFIRSKHLKYKIYIIHIGICFYRVIFCRDSII